MKYFFATLKHKWYVLLAGLKVGGIGLWRLFIHDWSKFTRAELLQYNRQFFGGGGDPIGFAHTWHHHIVNNPHHWNHWVVCGDYWTKEKGAVNGALEMPEVYVREMVADWMGASRAYTGSWDMESWLLKNLPNIVLHPDSRDKLFEVLKEQGYARADLEH